MTGIPRRSLLSLIGLAPIAVPMAVMAAHDGAAADRKAAAQRDAAEVGCIHGIFVTNSYGRMFELRRDRWVEIENPFLLERVKRLECHVPWDAQS